MDKRRSKTNALLDAQRAGCPAQQEMPESPCAPSALRIRARHGSPAGRGLTAPPAVRSPSQRRACAGGGRNVGVDGNQANERPVHAAGEACEKSVAGAGAAEAATVASASAVDASIDGDAAVAAAAFLSSSPYRRNFLHSSRTHLFVCYFRHLLLPRQAWFNSS